MLSQVKDFQSCKHNSGDASEKAQSRPHPPIRDLFAPFAEGSNTGFAAQKTAARSFRQRGNCQACQCLPNRLTVLLLDQICRQTPGKIAT